MVALFDVNGNDMGESAFSNAIIVDGGSIELTIGGAGGSAASETPEYIQVVATGSDEVCIAWLTTSSSVSDGADFRSWNGATGALCNVPWYHSTAQFPGVSITYAPPCVRMSNDGRFVASFSAHLLDFFFPGSSSSTSAIEQWNEFPDTLCKAPARQQFYNNTGECIPFYPSGLALDKNPQTGFDADFEAVESSFTMKCSTAGIPFNCDVDLVLNGPPNVVCSATIYTGTNPSFTLAPSITSELRSDITLAIDGSQVVATSSAMATDGEGNFGGVAGMIPASETRQPPIKTADGVGNFGGSIGEITLSETGQSPVQTADGAGNFGGVVGEITAIQSGQTTSTMESMTQTAVSTVPLPSGLGAKARARREADRAAVLRQRTASDAISTHQPAITPAPKYHPRGKIQRESSKNVTVTSKSDVRSPILERSIEKRDEEPHNWCQENQLVVSEHASHSAVQVCESDSSWGPDFVSISEGVFCDMCKRQYYPLCDGKKISTKLYVLTWGKDS